VTKHRVGGAEGAEEGRGITINCKVQKYDVNTLHPQIHRDSMRDSTMVTLNIKQTKPHLIQLHLTIISHCTSNIQKKNYS